MRRVPVAFVLIPLLALLIAGCASMKNVLSEADYSENYALEGECDVPQLNDGSMYSTAVTHAPEYIKGEQADDSRFTDAIITFKEPKVIKKIVVRRRREDSIPVDLNIMAMVGGEWTLIKEVRGEIKDDINIQVSTTTDKLRLRTQRATRTSKGKAAIVKPGGGRSSGRGRSTEVERVLREPIKFAEIEVYGLKPKQKT